MIAFCFRFFLTGALLLFSVVSVHGQETPLFLVLQDKKWGFMDQAGKIVVPAKFEYASPFSEGLARITAGTRREQEIGFIDSHGEPVIPPKYYEAGDFSEGLAPVALKTDKTRPCVDCSIYDWNMQWGFIDKTGRMAIEPRFRNAREFQEGLAAVQGDSGKWGFIDRAGALVVPFSFDYASYFSEGLAPVREDRHWGYIDTHGKWAVGPRFTSAHTFSEGKAIVKTGGVMDRRECGLPCPPATGGDWAVLDRKTLSTIDVRAYEIHRDFSEGLAAYFSDGNHCGYMDVEGRTVIAPRPGGCDQFSEGLGRVSTSTESVYIDRNGRTVVTSPTIEGFAFQGGLARVGEWWPDGGWRGYIDRTGKVVWSSGTLPARKRIRR